MQAKMSLGARFASNYCRIHCVGDWLVRGRVGVGGHCALCTACLCFHVSFHPKRSLLAPCPCVNNSGANGLNASATTKIVPVFVLL